MDKFYRNDWLLLTGFLLFLTGFISLILSMIGIQISFLWWIDSIGGIWAFLIRIAILLTGIIIAYLVRINR